ncbi:ABC transporter substrate-binding protein [Paenibacillus thiaminolyticus]|uniref:ABC transporter substrate-binding protein n=1 Tax=Paenibacillus thiaminolyticus TaxID=49283 RepID=UPI0035A5DEBF
MSRSYRFTAAWTALLLVLMFGEAGCVAQQEAGGEAPGRGEQSAQPAGSQNKPEAGTESESGGTRTVMDEFGEVKIPTHPQRVAGIYVEDYMVALGVEPIVQWYHPSWGKQDYLGLDVPLFDITGSIEALLETNPDLIIVDGGVDAAKYEMYSKIAPTYRLKEDILDDPAKVLAAIADLLGIPEKGESAVAQYQEKIADAKEKLSQSTKGETVAVLRLNVGDKTMALFGVKNRYTGTIYRNMGLTPHLFAREMSDYHAILSEEKLPELDADHIIIFPSNGSWSAEENKEAEQLLDSPLWKSLPAVQKGQVYKAERTHWQSGAITANMKKINDLLQWFVK